MEEHSTKVPITDQSIDRENAMIYEEGELRLSSEVSFSIDIPDEYIPDIAEYREDSIVLEIPDPETDRLDELGYGEERKEDFKKYYDGADYMVGLFGPLNTAIIGELFHVLRMFDEHDDHDPLINLLERMLVKRDESKNVTIIVE